MTSATAEPVVLKTDGRGRVRTPETRREALLDEFGRSGLSGIKFAALCGVKNPSFAKWVQRRKRRRTEATGWQWSGIGIPARCRNSGAVVGGGDR